MHGRIHQSPHTRHLTAGAALREEFVQLHGPLPAYHTWLAQLSDEPKLWHFQPDHISRSALLCEQLRDPHNLVSNFLRENLSPEAITAVNRSAEGSLACDTACSAIIKDLNRLVAGGKSLFHPDRFAEVKLSRETQALIAAVNNPPASDPQSVRSRNLEILNRLLLEEAFPEAVARVWDTMAAVIWLAH